MLFRKQTENEEQKETATITGVKIGEKTVIPRKITIAKWKQLFDSIQLLPQLFVTVVTAAPEDRVAYGITAMRESFTDMVRMTAILTELDEEYIIEHASIDQLIAFYRATIEENQFMELVKNVQNLFGSVMNRPKTDSN